MSQYKQQGPPPNPGPARSPVGPTNPSVPQQSSPANPTLNSWPEITITQLMKKCEGHLKSTSLCLWNLIRPESRGDVEKQSNSSQNIKWVLASQTVLLSEFDERGMKNWFAKLNLVKPPNLHIEQGRDRVTINLLGKKEEKEDVDLIMNFRSYFHCTNYVFFSENQARVIRKEAQLIKQRLEANIIYVEGFGPYTVEQLKKPENYKNQVHLIEMKDTQASATNTHAFRCVRVESTPNTFTNIIKQIKKAIEQAKPKEQIWLFELPPLTTGISTNKNMTALVQEKFREEAKRHPCCKSIGEIVWKRDGFMCKFIPVAGTSQTQTDQLHKSLGDILTRDIVAMELELTPEVAELSFDEKTDPKKYGIVVSQGKAYLVSCDGVVDMQQTKIAIEQRTISSSTTISLFSFEMLQSYFEQLKEKLPKTVVITEEKNPEEVVLKFSGPAGAVSTVLTEVREKIQQQSDFHWSFQIPVSNNDKAIIKTNNLLCIIQKEFGVRCKLITRVEQELILQISRKKKLVLTRRHHSLVDGSPLVVVLNQADMYLYSSEGKYPAPLTESYRMDRQNRVCLMQDLGSLHNILQQTELGWRIALVPPENKPLKAVYQEVMKVMSELALDSQVTVYFCSRDKEVSPKQEQLISWAQTQLDLLRNGTMVWKQIIGNQGYVYPISVGIQRAYNEGLPAILLTEDYLNRTDPTHRIYRDTSSFQNLHTSSKETLNQSPDGKYHLNGTELSEGHVAKIAAAQHLEYITLSAYVVDFKKMTITNQFTKVENKFTREPVSEIPVFFKNCLHAQIKTQLDVLNIYCDRTHEQNLRERIPSRLRQLLNERMKATDRLELGPKSLSIPKLRKMCFENNVELHGIQMKNNTLLVDLKAHSKKDIDNLKDQQNKFGSKEIHPTVKIAVPLDWANSRQDIAIYIVEKATEEFKRVQLMFKIAPIKRLLRVENKLIWRKYSQEKKHLEYITGEPIKQLELYHGTRAYDPRNIYEDKEEAFNINFSSESNLFGRGIYFAQEASYSDRYAHQDRTNGTRIMLNCRVLVGTSQEMSDKDRSYEIRDTKVRDAAKNIKFESIHSNYDGSDVYIVYKSSRAYPQYVIEY